MARDNDAQIKPVKKSDDGVNHGNDTNDVNDLNGVIIPASTNMGLQLGETRGNLTASIELQVAGLIPTQNGKMRESADAIEGGTYEIWIQLVVDGMIRRVDVSTDTEYALKGPILEHNIVFTLNCKISKNSEN